MTQLLHYSLSLRSPFPSVLNWFSVLFIRLLFPDTICSLFCSGCLCNTLLISFSRSNSLPVGIKKYPHVQISKLVLQPPLQGPQGS